MSHSEEKVTDRTLERLRLGELSEEEARAIFDRLEESGESHRLDRMIEEDERFLERYPAAAAAADIRAELRRRDREREREPRKIWRGARLVPVVVAVIVAAVTIGYIAAVSDEGPLAPETVAEKSSTETAETTAGSARPGPTREPWRGMLPWLLDQPTDGNSTPVFACRPGEEIELDATGVRRVSTDRSDLVNVRVSSGEGSAPTTADDDSSLVLTCAKLGSASVTLVVGDEEMPRNVTFRIGKPYATEGEATPALEEARREVESTCDPSRGTEVRVILDARGRPEKILVAGGESAAQRRCIRRVLVEHDGWPEGDYSRIASMEW